MTPEVELAIEEIRRTFDGHLIQVEGEPEGGAIVTVGDLNIGQVYTPAVTWCGFSIGYQYPDSDVYPHFIDGGVRRADGRGFGDGFSGPVTWRDRAAIQVSRRSNRWDPSVDTAVAKLIKVLDWVRCR